LNVFDFRRLFVADIAGLYQKEQCSFVKVFKGATGFGKGKPSGCFDSSVTETDRKGMLAVGY